MERIKKFVKRLNLSIFDMVLVGLMVIGGVLILWGLVGSGGKKTEDVEYLTGDMGDNEEMVWVDVAGAVEKPGVYELKKGSRVKDALVAAGGLSEIAKREYLEKIINMAQEVKDGEKIYIPRQGTDNGDGDRVLGSTPDNIGTGTIDINSASVSELDTLWGIGEVTAKKIIENRPYGKVEDLLEKGVLKSNVYAEIKDKVSVY